MITEERLRELLPLMETAWVEKTESMPKSLSHDRIKHKVGQAICAFANDLVDRKEPGYFIMGVSDDGTVVNQDFIEESLIQAIQSFRTDGRIMPPPSIQVQPFELPEGHVLVVEVMPAHYPPVRYENRIWIRTAQRRDCATVEEERRLTEKRISQARTYDLRPCISSDEEELDLEYIRQTYIPLSVSREVLRENGRTITEQLDSIRLYDGEYACPNNAAMLLFGKEVNVVKNYFPGAYIQYVRFSGNDILAESASDYIIQGNLVQQLDQIERFLESLIRRYQPEITAPQSFNYPLITLLELTYNAVIHRDYESNAPIKFYQFDNRIEIHNPGGLYGSVNLDNFPRANDYRNPVLAEAAVKLGHMQRFNVGIQKAKAAVERNGSPELEFELRQPSHFSVIIHIHEDHNTVQ